MKPTTQDDFIHYDHESRIVRLETTIENINQTLIRMEKRFDGIDNKLDKLDSRIWFVFCFLLTTMLGGFTALLGVMAHGFHWL